MVCVVGRRGEVRVRHNPADETTVRLPPVQPRAPSRRPIRPPVRKAPQTGRVIERRWTAGPGGPTATRSFVRGRGRHAAMSRRQHWESRYVRALLVSDLSAGLVAGAVTFGLRFGDDITAYNRWYLLCSALLPVALVLALAVSRAYERRYLFVGTDEYQRVFRGGVGLIAGAALLSYALRMELARSYVLAALPTAILAVEVADASEEQKLQTDADAEIVWLHRDGRPAGAAPTRSAEWPPSCPAVTRSPPNGR